MSKVEKVAEEEEVELGTTEENEGEGEEDEEENAKENVGAAVVSGCGEK